MQPEVSQLTSDYLRSQRESEIRDVEELSSRAVEAFRNADPMRAAMEKHLVDGIETDMRGEIDPFLQRQFTQGLRSAQAARGVGYGHNDVFAEAMHLAQTRDARRQSGQTAAMQFLGMPRPDPFLSVLNRTAIGQGMDPGAIPSGGPRFSDPFNPAFLGAAQQQQAMAYQGQLNRANAMAGIGGGLMSGGGALGGYAIANWPS